MPQSKSRGNNSRAWRERSESSNRSAEVHSSDESATNGDDDAAGAWATVAPAPGRRGRQRTLKQEHVASGSRWPCRILGALCALLVAYVHLYSNMDADHDFPCRCSEAGGGPLASALASRRLGLTGVHLHSLNRAAVREELAALSRCAAIHRLTSAFEDVPSFSKRLRRDAAHARCIVWLAEDVYVVRGVANAMKELLEDNALRGEHILRDGSRGLFVLMSNNSRGELTNILPHRVVHMFRTITL
ncbi:uncharacterized protein Tco025E_03380 [Trypanosoma conorhini]|uniref:Uncharacterized protein n=1 Tax=Trypanosoma conorhini TaxID=83891 RepID=A0A422PW96_9TRYP|nr:uncharacterized protein Tco025E_03380 [Trypanosoma conorhini]RNF22014.1 hypothetical protein Tco025E_03380 [Trypanosoma conorhini]